MENLRKYYDIWDDDDDDDPSNFPAAPPEPPEDQDLRGSVDGSCSDGELDSLRGSVEDQRDKHTQRHRSHSPDLPPELLLESPDDGIQAALRIYSDLEVRIPRDEVEEMARVVAQELDSIQPGCVHTICGGYRRGKSDSGDVDIVFTHPQRGVDRGLCKILVKHLAAKGMVTHVMHLSSFRAPDSLRKSTWDGLEKALTVFRLPPSSPFRKPSKVKNARGSSGSDGFGMHRRLDIIFAPIDVYWCAVLGWTGAAMFERDLRKWAKDKKGLKFDSTGITRQSDSSPVLAKSEMEVFDILGLPWIEPKMRNTDL